MWKRKSIIYWKELHPDYHRHLGKTAQYSHHKEGGGDEDRSPKSQPEISNYIISLKNTSERKC